MAGSLSALGTDRAGSTGTLAALATDISVDAFSALALLLS
jgi:hypothetical protein